MVPLPTVITFVLLPMMTSQTSLQIHLVLLQDSPLEMFNEAATTKQNEMTHATTSEQQLMHRTLQTKDICIMRSKCCFRFLLAVQKEMRRPSRCLMHAITIQHVHNHDFIDQRYSRRKSNQLAFPGLWRNRLKFLCFYDFQNLTKIYKS